MILGVDPAQSQDWCGMVFAEYVPWIDEKTGRCKIVKATGTPLAALRVRHIERYRKLDNEDLLKIINQHRKELKADLHMIVGDDTGIGVGLWDMLRNHGTGRIILKRVKFTTGESERSHGLPLHHHNVAKSLIVSALVTMVESRRVKIAPHLKLGPVILEEAKSWRAKITTAQNEVYVHQDSEHDDLVSSLALIALVSQRIWGQRYLSDLVDWDAEQREEELAVFENEARLDELANRLREEEERAADEAEKKVRAEMSAEDAADLRERDEQARADRIREARARAARNAACWGDADWSSKEDEDEMS